MAKPERQTAPPDPTAVARKRDHIALAFESQIASGELDERFHYEPLLSAHPERGSWPEMDFLGKRLKAPLWVSSMTGGTEWARLINHNLARACGEFGMGMGLGSCRALLYDDEHIEDFAVRPLIGEERPLFANLGIAQVEELAQRRRLKDIEALLGKLQADGLIVHVNPLQEWLQPEGDALHHPPVETLERLLEVADYPVIVKEVGQGMGPESLHRLLQLPLAALDFAANGGTNFSMVELLRSTQMKQEAYECLTHVGHDALSMLRWVNALVEELGERCLCRRLIISGGVKNFLDGYYLLQKSTLPAVYGQASAFLRHARGSYEELAAYVDSQIRGLELARAFLRVRP
ncbi:MAG: type 2 isopentenyl-diphosphate Delta-isomerase [Bacteroidetes bacterium]|nr:MAG: type 2 isopentenyl-diphosphate Delta-isomerase [Bacteroidota bacterium]